MSRQYLFGFLLLTGLYACKGSSETEAVYKAAFEKQQKVIEQIEEIEQLLDTQTSQLKDSLETVLNEFEEGLFEIPGYELELPGHEGHDHGHERVGLTAEEMLAAQEDLLKELLKIKSMLANDQ